MGIPDTTALRKEISDSAHAVLEFGEIETALRMAALWVQLDAVLMCAGMTDSAVTPMPWRPFGEYRPGKVRMS